jgi:hypothetical protein
MSPVVRYVRMMAWLTSSSDTSEWTPLLVGLFRASSFAASSFDLHVQQLARHASLALFIRELEKA